MINEPKTLYKVVWDDREVESNIMAHSPADAAVDFVELTEARQTEWLVAGGHAHAVIEVYLAHNEIPLEDQASWTVTVACGGPSYRVLGTPW